MKMIEVLMVLGKPQKTRKKQQGKIQLYEVKFAFVYCEPEEIVRTSPGWVNAKEFLS